MSGTVVLVATGRLGSAGAGGMYLQTTTSSNMARTSSLPSTTSTGASSVKVSIVPGAHSASQAQHFVPDTITIVIGVNNTVEWVNQDSVTHTVTADNGAFDSGDLASGSTFSFTFTAPGTFQYHCNIHPFMTGTIIVLGSNGQSISGPVGGSSSPSASVTTSSPPGW